MIAQFLDGWMRFWTTFYAPLMVVFGFLVAAFVFSVLWSMCVGIVRGLIGSIK